MARNTKAASVISLSFPGRWTADCQRQLPLLMLPIRTPILRNHEYKTKLRAQNNIYAHRKDING